jgi:transposase InsO family protein
LSIRSKPEKLIVLKQSPLRKDRMDIHKNARLTLRRREELVQQFTADQTLKRAAARFNVTAKTAAKWVHRYRALGAPGLLDRSSRPLRSPRKTSAQLAAQVIALRRQLRPAYQIAETTRLSSATVSRILQRAHLNRWRHLHPAPPVVRYEHPAPGDMLHLDIKGMTRYQQVSIRGDGRRRGRPRFAGWQALHVAIDDHSRLAFSRMLPNQKTETAIAFLHHALAFYAQRGIRIRRLLTDNGSCYRSHLFRAACAQLGIRHRFTRPYTPRTNGKAERFIQTALREWAYVRHYSDSLERDSQLAPWLDYYNFRRPHGSLGYAPPISRAPVFDGITS